MNGNSNKNTNKRCFKKCSKNVETYRRILKAWITPNHTLTTDLDDSCGQLNNTSELTNSQTNKTLKDANKSIDLNDSLDSIPESPEFVEKRKALKKEKNNTKIKKSFVNQFIDFEAEVVNDSKESFCDDIENTQKESENSSQTIIDDIIPADTQPIGQLIGGIDSRSAKDMQTVYLRSVKEKMIGNTDKYKLQYNFDPNIDVFSQIPNESDFEDYEFDSFCVPNDTIVFDELSPQKTTNTIEMSIESPSPQIHKKSRKKFKRIVFSP